MSDIKTLNGHNLVDTAATAKLNSVIETVGGDTLTWDGNVEGLESIFDSTYYKISNALVTMNDLSNGFVVKANGETIEIPAEVIEEDSGAIVTPAGLFVQEDVEGLGTVGVYVSMEFINIGCVITIPGYTGFTKEIIKQDALPEALQFGIENTLILSGENVEFSGGMVDLQPVEIIVGSEYTVVWDGVEYVCTAQDDGDGGFGIGNTTGEGTEPFLFVWLQTTEAYIIDYNAMMSGEDSLHSYALIGQLVKKIDPKFENAADYDVADKNAAGYIKNRPFYTDEISNYAWDGNTADKTVVELSDGRKLCRISTDVPFGNGKILVCDVLAWNSMYGLPIMIYAENKRMYNFNGKFSCVFYQGDIVLLYTRTDLTNCAELQNLTGLSSIPAGVYAGFVTDESGNMKEYAAEIKIFTTVDLPEYYLPSGVIGWEGFEQSFCLMSSTGGSVKRFRITVDDSGTLKATEIGY